MPGGYAFEAQLDVAGEHIDVRDGQLFRPAGVVEDREDPVVHAPVVSPYSTFPAANWANTCACRAGNSENGGNAPPTLTLSSARDSTANPSTSWSSKLGVLLGGVELIAPGFDEAAEQDAPLVVRGVLPQLIAACCPRHDVPGVRARRVRRVEQAGPVNDVDDGGAGVGLRRTRPGGRGRSASPGPCSRPTCRPSSRMGRRCSSRRRTRSTPRPGQPRNPDVCCAVRRPVRACCFVTAVATSRPSIEMWTCRGLDLGAGDVRDEPMPTRRVEAGS